MSHQFHHQYSHGASRVYHSLQAMQERANQRVSHE